MEGAAKPLRAAKRTTRQPYIDSHVHLDHVLQFAGLPLEALKGEAARVFGEGFAGAVNVALAPTGLEDCARIAREHAGVVHTAWGTHPLDASKWVDSLGPELCELVGAPESVAWGEIGLDYHYDKSPRDVQRDVFRKQLRLAATVGKPVVVHARQADDDAMEIMKGELPEGWPIHLHCFTGQWAFAEQMLSAFPNLHIGLTGTVTFRNAKHLREVAVKVPFERLLLETDGPFMTPEPHRGDVAHPGHIPTVAAAIAQCRGCTMEEVLRRCLANTKEFYKIQ
eukprot:TRINITY_DN18818_c0_g1_i1.p1 TRINITY_DN18818_c0_g1~~TRINITY_DN18818_c0_g1_i1.p1  ORF type:complete len:292 (-),score=78.92 TRINITY_DN18818_c0_g1_i1:8-850(-)